ncbi:hypothetical protein MKW92_010521 [Papaver armeniacum]|nr:hypothetical protein MKW92_010521 [Papaver armeniacum]
MSPKATLPVIGFAVIFFNKHAVNSISESGNCGTLKFWLVKLAPLVCHNNKKLKEDAITCIVSVFTQFDSTSVLNFIFSVSVEEPNSIQHCSSTTRVQRLTIQSKIDRYRSGSFYDQSDIGGTSSEDGYTVVSEKSNFFLKSIPRVPLIAMVSGNGMPCRSHTRTVSADQAPSDETHENIYHSFDSIPQGEQLVVDAPEMIEKALSSEQDPSAKRNAFLMLFACAQERVINYLLANGASCFRWRYWN